MDLKQFLAEIERHFGTREELVRKAADPFISTTLTTGGTKQELANAFIDQVVEQSKLLKLVTVHRTDAPSGNITKLNIAGPITESATENSEGTNTRRPTNTTVSFVNKKLRSMLDLTGETSEDNVEGSGIRNKVTSMVVKRVKNDLEMLGIEGDTSLVGSDDTTRLMSANNGWHVQTDLADGAHVVDTGAKRPSYKLLSEMLRNMPTKYKTDKSELRWIISDGVAQAIVDEWAARSTTAGDKYRETGELGTILGIKAEIVPFMPEDLTITGTNSTGTFIWLTNPKNFIWVVQRDMQVEWERRPRYDRDELTIYTRNDFVVEETDAVVKAINVLVDPAVAYYGA